jgi:hypothetical protein
VNAAGAAALNTLCGTNVFMPNRPQDVTEMTCTPINLQPFSTCPMRFSIGKPSANGIQIAQGSCASTTRPTDLSVSFDLVRITNYPGMAIQGIWQGNCFYDSTLLQSFGMEFQVLRGMPLLREEDAIIMADWM